jgi:cell division protease FtsH
LSGTKPLWVKSRLDAWRMGESRSEIAGLTAFLIFGAACSLALSILAQSGDPPKPSIALNDLARAVKDARVRSLEITDDRGVAVTTEGESYSFRISQGSTVLATLSAYDVTPSDLSTVRFEAKPPSSAATWLRIAASLLPLVFCCAIVLSMRRSTNESTEEMLGLPQSRARRSVPALHSIRFADVAGVEEAKQELKEIVEFLRYPDRFDRLGAHIPRGLLLVGSPGTGKTLLARAVAGEAMVPFFSISGSEFVEIFVGLGAQRVRDLFERAKRDAPCIVFVDEIDALGRQRSDGLGSGSEERDQTLNQMLVEMDGFETNRTVVVIAATNRPDILDTALLRPGRFDRRIVLPAPDVSDRRAILLVHAKSRPLNNDVDFGVLAGLTPGFSGAELANVVNEAAILTARRNKARIGMSELEEAIDRVISGPECRSRVTSDGETKLTAYHEAGHALVMRYVPHHDPLQKVSIVRRGTLGGYTRSLPAEDRTYTTTSQLGAMLASSLGGHAAERIVFGEVSSCAAPDVEKATNIARRMVTEYGMSTRLGRLALGDGETMRVVGRELGEQKDYSEKTAEAIDAEVRLLIDEAYARAVRIITEHREALERITRALIQSETLEGDALERVIQGIPTDSGS